MATKKKAKKLTKKTTTPEVEDDPLDSIFNLNLHYASSGVLRSPNIRITVVVVEKTTWQGKDGQQSFKLPCGMAAAQAAHAVSKLKLDYVLEEARTKGTKQALDAASSLSREGITTIILKARDSKELAHIAQLIGRENILSARFYDTNEKIYGPGVSVATALAIGPLFSGDLNGITDYLPLWKCSCDPQG